VGDAEVGNSRRNRSRRRAKNMRQLGDLEFQITIRRIRIPIQREDAIDGGHGSEQRYELRLRRYGNFPSARFDQGGVADELNRIAEAAVAADEDPAPCQRRAAPQARQVARQVAPRLAVHNLIADAPCRREMPVSHVREPLCREIGGHTGGHRNSRSCAAAEISGVRPQRERSGIKKITV
jgi:hypothetical protein